MFLWLQTHNDKLQIKFPYLPINFIHKDKGVWKEKKTDLVGRFSISCLFTAYNKIYRNYSFTLTPFCIWFKLIKGKFGLLILNTSRFKIWFCKKCQQCYYVLIKILNKFHSGIKSKQLWWVQANSVLLLIKMWHLTFCPLLYDEGLLI